MNDLDHKECPDCGVQEHVETEYGVVCTNCGLRDSAEELGDCEHSPCPRDSTHLVVYNAVQGSRRTERYCETHADLAAEEAERDKFGDLFMGPVEIAD
jgi:hypothetical protein